MQASFCSFIKKETLAQVFSCEFSEILRIPILKNISGGCFCYSTLHFSEIKLGRVITRCTAKNTIISPNFLKWKFCGKAQFPHISGECVTFLYPLKTSENQIFSDVFRGYRNVTHSTETMWKLCLSAKFPLKEIRWNYGIFHSGAECLIFGFS